jgi:hypothetical protein
MPVMASVLKEFGPRGVRIIALSVEPKDSADEVSGWMTQYGGDGLETGAADTAAAKKLHALGGVDFQYIPSTVFVSPGGAVKRVMGHADRVAITEAVKSILP